jgi:glutamate/aspartate transport system substrate-binding protein
MRGAAALLLVALGLVAADAAHAQDLHGTLKKIKDSGAIALGFREGARPFSFAGPDGRPAGYSVDLCVRIAESVRQQVGLAALKTEWIPVTPATRIPSIVSGAIDLECGSSTITLGRQTQVDFSYLTFVDGGSLLASGAAGITTVADLARKRVAVIPGTTTEKALADALQKAWVTDAQIVPVKEHLEGLAAVEQGRAAAYASDRLVLVGLQQRAKDPSRLRVSGQYFSYEPYALMLRRDDPDFRLAVNRALVKLYQSVHITQVYEAWFGRFSQASALVRAMYSLNSLPD